MARDFQIAIDEPLLELLQQRLDTSRWPNVPIGADGHGVARDRIQDLVEHWRTRFDWREFEAGLNRLRHVVSDAGDYRLHLVHERTDEPSGVPVVLLHGWPDTFLRYRKVVPLLVAAGHDVVVPSLPGFAFSGQPAGPLTVAGAAERIHDALAELSVDRYVVHGGDFGSVVADEIARTYRDEVVGLHLTDVPFPKAFGVGVDRASLTEAEQRMFTEGAAWMRRAVYFKVQSAEPLTLAYALTDSPVGLLAWIADKFDAWSDRVDPDDVVGVTAMTWLTGTTWSGFRMYAEGAGPAASRDDISGEGLPTGFSLFPRDITRPPREYAERFFNVVDWRIHDEGGHFAATEVPEVFAADLLTFLARFQDRWII